MSSGGGIEAKDMAVEKYREATLWWVGVRKAVTRWRALAVYYLAVRSLGLRHQRARALAALLATREEIKNLARAATACEMGGRIYEEEHEDREWAFAKRYEEMEIYGRNRD